MKIQDELPVWVERAGRDVRPSNADGSEALDA